MRNAGLLILMVMPAAGCGTLSDLGRDNKDFPAARIYGGVRTDLEMMENHHPHVEGLAQMIGVLDFPFSLALDTGVLPITLLVALFREPPPEPKRNPPAPPAEDQ